MKNTIKKITVASITASVILGTSLSAMATTNETNGGWSQFRGDTERPGITDSKTPITKDNTKAKWSIPITNSWMDSAGYPIEVGDNIYVSAGKKIKKLSKSDGKLLAESNLAESVGFFSQIAYGDGKIFVPIGSGRVQAFEEKSLKPIWISPKQDLRNQQALSPIIYNNGYVYMGIGDGNASVGRFYCLSTKDENPATTDEEKVYTWQYASKSQSGYYWSGGAVAFDNIVFGGESGDVVSHNLVNDKVIDTIHVNGAIRSTIHFDKSTNMIYFTTKAGNIHSVKLNSDGTFDKSSLKTKFIADDITSSPVVYNGRVYVGGGGISSSAPFTVLKADTLEIEYQIPIISQSSPIITTAYATKENKNTVYMYALDFSNPYNLYCIKDFEGNKQPIIETIATPSQPQYNSSSVAVGNDGTLYFKNDSGYLFAFSNNLGGNYTVQDVINVIDRLPNNITVNDEYEINQINTRYNGLSIEDRAKVSNSKTLVSAINTINTLKNEEIQVGKLIDAINKLPAIVDSTIEANEKQITDLVVSYNSLSDKGKAKITNYSRLQEANNKITELKNTKYVNQIIDEINSLKPREEIVLDNKAEVDEIYKKYNELSSENKALVNNSEKLIKNKEKVDAIDGEIKDINQTIWDNINPSNITIKDKETVLSTIKRYEALNSQDKKHVAYYNEVLEAKDIIDKLETENGNKENITDSEVKDQKAISLNDKLQTSDVKQENSIASASNEKVVEQSANTIENNNKLPKAGSWINSKLIISVGVLMMVLGSTLILRKKRQKSLLTK